MVAYQAKMLLGVDYKKIEKREDFSLKYLEQGIMQDCSDFFDSLKTALLQEGQRQSPELLVAHLCAYLGTAATVHTVHEALVLESAIIDLIQEQAQAAYQLFNQYPLNNTIRGKEKKRKNLEKLRHLAPGSIIVQTVRLGRVLSKIINELQNNQQQHVKKVKKPKQEQLFCSQETLIKTTLVVCAIKCAEWRKHFSDNDILNQLAIQIGWLIGYFSHLEERPPEQTRYFDYGLPLLKFYLNHTYQLMHCYYEATQTQNEDNMVDNLQPERLLSEIRELSKKTQAQCPIPINDFQKQVVIITAGIEKTVMELVTQEYSIKAILMSLFYFWFTLEAPLHTSHPDSIDASDPFLHMTAIIELVKDRVQGLPEPKLTPELKALNEKMQLLKSYLPHPKELDMEVPKNLEHQSIHINTAIHTVTSDFLKQDIYNLEPITIALFSHWLRCSVFFGVTESYWQKMDYYFSDILEAVRAYLRSIYGSKI